MRLFVWKNKLSMYRKGDSGNSALPVGHTIHFKTPKAVLCMYTCVTYNRFTKQECWQAAHPLFGLNLLCKHTNSIIATGTGKQQVQEKDIPSGHQSHLYVRSGKLLLKHALLCQSRRDHRHVISGQDFKGRVEKLFGEFNNVFGAAVG